MAKHVLLRSSGYYFRFVIPKHHQGLLPVRELKYPLRTRSLAVATRRAAALAALLENLLKQLGRRMDLDQEQAHRIVRQYAQQQLKEFESEYGWEPTGFHPDQLTEQVDLVEGQEANLAADLKHGDYQAILPKARRLLDASGFTYEVDSGEFRTFCRLLIEAEIELHGRYAATMRGQRARSFLIEPLPQMDSAAQASISDATPILEAYADFERERLQSNKWRPETARGYEATIREFDEFYPDKPVEAVSRKDVVNFLGHLKTIPRHRFKSPLYRELTLEELQAIDVPEEHLRHGRTIQEALGRVKSFLKWCSSSGLLLSHPAADVTYDARSDKRSHFTDDDLRAVFESNWYQQRAFRKTYQFWLPLICVYSGTRISEVSQLLVTDITEEDGIALFRIQEDREQGRLLKTDAATRRIPIHRDLIEYGLLDYLRVLREKGHNRVFPDLTLGKRTAGQNASKWLNPFLRSIGIEDRSKVAHSFRHTFNHRLVANDQPIAKIQRLMGHSMKGLGETATYTGQFKARELSRVVETLSFDFEKGRLKDGWRDVTTTLSPAYNG